MAKQNNERTPALKEFLGQYERLGIPLPDTAYEVSSESELRTVLAGHKLATPVALTQLCEVDRFDSDADLVYRIVNTGGEYVDGSYIQMTRLDRYSPITCEQKIEQTKVRIDVLKAQLEEETQLLDALVEGDE